MGAVEDFVSERDPFTDRDTLRTLPFALLALNACVPSRGQGLVLSPSGLTSEQEDVVQEGKGPGDIYPLGTRHTVRTPGALVARHVVRTCQESAIRVPSGVDRVPLLR